MIDHNPAFASAIASQAVAPAAHCRYGLATGTSPDGCLYVGNIGAAGDQARHTRYHAIPNTASGFVQGVVWTEQISVEPCGQ